MLLPACLSKKIEIKTKVREYSLTRREFIVSHFRPLSRFHDHRQKYERKVSSAFLVGFSSEEQRRQSRRET